MTKVAELLGHTERVLYMAMSPDGSVVVSHSVIHSHPSPFLYRVTQ